MIQQSSHGFTYGAAAEDDIMRQTHRSTYSKLSGSYSSSQGNEPEAAVYHLAPDTIKITLKPKNHGDVRP